MARKRDRAFALSLAILFFITAFGFTFYAIWQSSHNNSPSSQTNNCSSTPSETALAAPTVYQTSTTPTSLQVTDLTTGSGATANNGSCLTVQYYGTLASNGTLFDEDFTKATGFEFQLGAGQVIKGWDQGLVGMKVGGMRRLVIPPSLGYGNTAQGIIPANSTLVFVVKLLNVQ
jgi:peptidylprolyl isomerase